MDFSCSLFPKHPQSVELSHSKKLSFMLLNMALSPAAFGIITNSAGADQHQFSIDNHTKSQMVKNSTSLFVTSYILEYISMHGAVSEKVATYTYNYRCETPTFLYHC
jgi:hypothetical protein